jgi:hypothetical protein
VFTPVARDRVFGAGVPEHGDVVIRTPGSERSFNVSCVPGPDQVRCATRADAERLAGCYAEHAGVNVWAAERPNGFTLVATFRGSTGRQLRKVNSPTDAVGAEACSQRTERKAKAR